MLDLVIPSPCILIYQILPFVSTFHWPGTSFSWFTSPWFLLWSLWEDQWMCGVGCGSSGCLIRWFGVLYSGFWILGLIFAFQWLLRALFISAIMGQCVLSSLEIVSLGSIFLFPLSGLLCFLLVPILIEFVFLLFHPFSLFIWFSLQYLSSPKLV